MSAHSVCVPHDVLRRLSREPELLGVFCLLLSEADSTFVVPLRGEDLAALIGRSRASAYRYLRRLERAGLLRSDRQRLPATVRRLVVGEQSQAEGGGAR